MRIVRRLLRSPLAVSVFVSILVALGIIALRSVGGLESGELAAYDWYIRLRPEVSMSNPRVVLIAIDESDIREQRGWPLTDATLARALEGLMQYQPRAIGLDIFRDMPVPPGHEALRAMLTGNRHIITVMKVSEGKSDSVSPPPVPEGSDQVGFSDILVDRDGIVRRGLLFMDDGDTVAYSFALRLALRYLQAQGITPQPDASDPDHIRLGPTTIPPFAPNDGGYVAADARGYQFLLDFREPPGVFPSFPLTRLLSKTIDPKAIKDKVVLIGVNAVSVRDAFRTPYSHGQQADPQMPGVELHAHVVSQLLRIALEGKSPVTTMSDLSEGAWILLWSAIGGVIAGWGRSPWRFLWLGITGLLIFGLTYIAFLWGWWLPLVPPAGAWLISAAIVALWMWSVYWKGKREKWHIHLYVERERLAKFVVPRARVIDEIHHTVCKQLGSPAPHPNSTSSLRRWAKELYEALAAHKIVYTYELLTYGAEQEIRPPKDVMADGVANCLETSLLYAAALECSRMSPVIIHLHYVKGLTVSPHTLCGFWNSSAPVEIEALVTDEGRIRRLIQDQRIIPIETLGFTVRKTDHFIPGKEQIAFDEAVDVARRQLTDVEATRINFLLNIQHLRKEYGYGPTEEEVGVL